MKKFFSLLWQGWKKFAHVLGIINTKILLTISYFIVMALAAIVSRIVRADLLDRRMKPAETFWRERDAMDISLEGCRRQF